MSGVRIGGGPVKGFYAAYFYQPVPAVRLTLVNAAGYRHLLGHLIRPVEVFEEKDIPQPKKDRSWKNVQSLAKRLVCVLVSTCGYLIFREKRIRWCDTQAMVYRSTHHIGRGCRPIIACSALS